MAGGRVALSASGSQLGQNIRSSAKRDRIETARSKDRDRNGSKPNSQPGYQLAQLKTIYPRRWKETCRRDHCLLGHTASWAKQLEFLDRLLRSKRKYQRMKLQRFLYILLEILHQDSSSYLPDIRSTLQGINLRLACLEMATGTKLDPGAGNSRIPGTQPSHTSVHKAALTPSSKGDEIRAPQINMSLWHQRDQ